MKYGILILNRNGQKWLQALYESLRLDGYGNKRVYLVDNQSTDGSQDFTRKHYPEVKVLQMPENLGYSMAYNLCMEIAFSDGCDWVSWQNNDTLVEPGWLNRLTEVAAADPKIGVMGPVFRDWDKPGPSPFMYKRYPEVIPFWEDSSRPPVNVDWVEGSVLLTSRACFDDVGPLEADLFFYWEDTDFCRRAQYHGWRVVLVPGAVVRHYGGGSTGSISVSAINFNTLKTHNHFVFKYCDPNRSRWRNFLSCLRLLGVQGKKGLRGETPIQNTRILLGVFAQFLGGLPRWSCKWKRDREGEHGPKLTTAKASIQLNDTVVG
jgi:GT2 family glycosyltransferase